MASPGDAPASPGGPQTRFSARAREGAAGSARRTRGLALSKRRARKCTDTVLRRRRFTLGQDICPWRLSATCCHAHGTTPPRHSPVLSWRRLSAGCARSSKPSLRDRGCLQPSANTARVGAPAPPVPSCTSAASVAQLAAELLAQLAAQPAASLTAALYSLSLRRASQPRSSLPSDIFQWEVSVLSRD